MSRVCESLSTIELLVRHRERHGYALLDELETLLIQCLQNPVKTITLGPPFAHVVPHSSVAIQFLLELGFRPLYFPVLTSSSSSRKHKGSDDNDDKNEGIEPQNTLTANTTTTRNNTGMSWSSSNATSNPPSIPTSSVFTSVLLTQEEEEDAKRLYVEEMEKRRKRKLDSGEDRTQEVIPSPTVNTTSGVSPPLFQGGRSAGGDREPSMTGSLPVLMNDDDNNSNTNNPFDLSRVRELVPPFLQSATRSVTAPISSGENSSFPYHRQEKEEGGQRSNKGREGNYAQLRSSEMSVSPAQRQEEEEEREYQKGGELVEGYIARDGSVQRISAPEVVLFERELAKGVAMVRWARSVNSTLLKFHLHQCSFLKALSSPFRFGLVLQYINELGTLETETLVSEEYYDGIIENSTSSLGGGASSNNSVNRTMMWTKPLFEIFITNCDRVCQVKIEVYQKRRILPGETTKAIATFRYLNRGVSLENIDLHDPENRHGLPTGHLIVEVESLYHRCNLVENQLRRQMNELKWKVHSNSNKSEKEKEEEEARKIKFNSDDRKSGRGDGTPTATCAATAISSTSSTPRNIPKSKATTIITKLSTSGTAKAGLAPSNGTDDKDPEDVNEEEEEEEEEEDEKDTLQQHAAMGVKHKYIEHPVLPPKDDGVKYDDDDYYGMEEDL